MNVGEIYMKKVNWERVTGQDFGKIFEKVNQEIKGGKKIEEQRNTKRNIIGEEENASMNIKQKGNIEEKHKVYKCEREKELYRKIKERIQERIHRVLEALESIQEKT